MIVRRHMLKSPTWSVYIILIIEKRYKIIRDLVLLFDQKRVVCIPMHKDVFSECRSKIKESCSSEETVGRTIPKTIMGASITAFEWGNITVKLPSGESKTFKDAKIWHSGAKTWDWKETGTRHKPGIQPSDGEELLAHGITSIILSRGMDLVLEVPEETQKHFRSLGLTVYVLQSEEAVAKFTELASSGQKVGLLLHSTC